MIDGMQPNGGWDYKYKQGETLQHMNITGYVEINDPGGSRKHDFYHIETAPHPKRKKASVITKLQYMGKDIDLTNAKAVSMAIKTIRNTNRTIRAGDQALIEDLQKPPQDRRYALPSEVSLFTNLYDHLNEDVEIPPEGIMSVHFMGGANRRKYVSNADGNIGANQSVVSYEYIDENGEKKSVHIMVDAGVLFHDVFNVAFYNAGRYLYHKDRPNDVPEKPLSAILLTHSHEDHTGQLAYLAREGYILPPMVMNAMTKAKFKRDLNNLGIKSPEREEILERCHVIDPFVNEKDFPSDKTKTVDVKGTKIKQSGEMITDPETGEENRYPVLGITDFFKIRAGPMQHSAPGFMYDVITPAGSTRFIGDGKLDDTMPVKMLPVLPWMQAFPPDTIAMDSTGATNTEGNPREAEVMESIYETFMARQGKRFICPMIGSNLTRLYSLIEAMGKAGRNTLIVDGKAVEDLVRDASKDKFLKIKEWARKKHGVEIIMQTAKKTVEKIYEDRSKDGEYVILASGSQFEGLSSIARAAKDANGTNRYTLRKGDVVCVLQGCIPVGDNAKTRKAYGEYLENFHQAEAIFPEAVTKEKGMSVKHASGHNDAKGIQEKVAHSSMPAVFTIHGNNRQLDACAALVEDMGGKAINVKATQSYRIQKGKRVTPYRHERLEMVGITLHTPTKEQFWLKRHFNPCVIPIKPEIDKPDFQLMDEFEQCAIALAGRQSPLEMQRTSPISLSRHFNAQAANNYMLYRIPFGIEKYNGNVFDAKNIFAYGAFDTETGGKDALFHLIREFSMTLRSTDRETLASTQIFQRIPLERTPGAMAMLVTNVAPEDLDIGDNNIDFTNQMNNAIKALKEKSYEIAQIKKPKAKLKKNAVKALAIAHNFRFDDRFVAAEHGRNLNMDRRSHLTKGIISVDTRNISRALAAYRPDKYKLEINPETGLADHRLESLCRANGIQVDSSKTHAADYDTELCALLFEKQYDIDPDLVGQMIINSDSATQHTLTDMTSITTGFDGPHAVFSYVSPLAQRPKPQMGCLVTTMDAGKFVVVFNLKYDPADYLYRSAEEINAMMKDPDNDVFEVINMRQQPIIMPQTMGMRAHAAGNLPKETLDRRAGAISRHINFANPKENWQTLPQIINEHWEDIRANAMLRIAKERDDGIDLFTPPPSDLRHAPSPDNGVSQLLKTNAAKTFNVTYKEMHKLLREYLGALRNHAHKESRQLYNELLDRYRKPLGDAVDTINYVHYKFRPQDLKQKDRQRTESMISCMITAHYRELKKEIDMLLDDDELFAKYVGDDPQKRENFSKWYKWAADNAHLATLSDGAKRLLHPHSDDSRAYKDRYSNDNDSILQSLAM